MSGWFTEDEYRDLVAQAAQRFEFVGYSALAPDAPHVLWRHDVDMSMHRAAKLAQIEADVGVRATYFVHLHSRFYNAFEPEIVQLIAKIANFGHWIGLHADPQTARPGRDVSDQLNLERTLLAEVAGVAVDAVSFHDPDLGGLDESDVVSEMTNASSTRLREAYRYCSDSNGIWRFQPLLALLNAPDIGDLHVLTHPEWWTPEPLTPRARVQRCIAGRAARQGRAYDAKLAEIGRPNLGS
ncbi:MAG TPA: hypothetical protein VGO31_05315 [Microbacteriaceae bacterium]|nr:hypothetical protein [Microbacteriaceae bacterium]